MDLTEFMSCLMRFQRTHPEQVVIFEDGNYATQNYRFRRS